MLTTRDMLKALKIFSSSQSEPPTNPPDNRRIPVHLGVGHELVKESKSARDDDKRDDFLGQIGKSARKPVRRF